MVEQVEKRGSRPSMSTPGVEALGDEKRRVLMPMGVGAQPRRGWPRQPEDFADSTRRPGGAELFNSSSLLLPLVQDQGELLVPAD